MVGIDPSDSKTVRTVLDVFFTFGNWLCREEDSLRISNTVCGEVNSSLQFPFGAICIETHSISISSKLLSPIGCIFSCDFEDEDGGVDPNRNRETDACSQSEKAKYTSGFDRLADIIAEFPALASKSRMPRPSFG